MTEPTTAELRLAREIANEMRPAWWHGLDAERKANIAFGGLPAMAAAAFEAGALAAIRATGERAAALADRFGQAAYSEGMSEEVVMARSHMASDIVSALSAGQHLETTV